MFSKIFSKIIIWSRTKNSIRILSFISFIEAIFFPLPPDMLLIPMCLASRKKAFHFAAITTFFSVLGGVFGYLIGMFMYDSTYLFMVDLGYQEKILQVKQFFSDWGIWIILLAGFTPIPYKLFTIIAGALSMPFFGFIFASFLGRGARFFLIALLISLGGDVLKQNIQKNIEYIGWLTLIFITVFISIHNFAN